MQTPETIVLPEELEPFRREFVAAVKPSVSIEVEPNESLAPWNSKFGGEPYLPLGTPYIYNEVGEPMALLAQINFEELPEMENYPNSGLLQFFIEGDRIYESLASSESIVKLRYYPTVVKNRNELMRDLHLQIQGLSDAQFRNPITRQHALSFSEVKNEMIDLDDRSFENIFGMDFYDLCEKLGAPPETVEHTYKAMHQPVDGHKIGGYGYFVQSDRRCEEDGNTDKTELLLQLDSDEFILWGDMGLAQTFINPEDLKNKVFDDIFFTWDCC